MRFRRALQLWTAATAMAVVVVLGTAGCASTTVPRRPLAPTRARAFVDTFDRILIAGFLADEVSNMGRYVDINDETSRLHRMTLRSRASLDVIEAQPLDRRRRDAIGGSPDERVLTDVAFWRRLGEEYREPLSLTGRVVFTPVGSQFEETHDGPADGAPVAPWLQPRGAIGVHQWSDRRSTGFGVARPGHRTRSGWTDLRPGSVFPADGQIAAVAAGGAGPRAPCGTHSH